MCLHPPVYQICHIPNNTKSLIKKTFIFTGCAQLKAEIWDGSCLFFLKPWFEKLLFFGTSMLILSFYALKVTALLYSGATLYTVHSSVAMLIEQQSNSSHILMTPHCCWFQKDLGKINSGSVCLQSVLHSVSKRVETQKQSAVTTCKLMTHSIDWSCLFVHLADLETLQT